MEMEASMMRFMESLGLGLGFGEGDADEDGGN